MDDVSEKFAPLTEGELSAVQAFASPEADESERIAQAQAILRSCKAIAGTPGEAYLRGRGIDPSALPKGVVGWHKESRALVFPARDAHGAIRACQRLFFGASDAPVVEAGGKKKRRTNGVLGGSALILPGDGDVLVCEGAEDGLSLWAATGWPVRCALGVAGLGEVPLPAGAAAVIVADNDKAGLEGAHKGALRLAERGHDVKIAVPPDGAKDANELLTKCGILAVKTMVENAEPLEPGPSFVSFAPYEMTEHGLTIEIERGRGGNKTTEIISIAGPFEILGASRDADGRGWGKWLRWHDADGRIHVRHVAEAALQGDPAALCAGLASDGVRINRAHQRAFAHYLSSATVPGRVTIVARTGWHEINGRFVFVLPGETCGPCGVEKVILDSAAVGPYAARGSLKDWQDGIGKLASGHALAVLAISTALAGPLLQLAGQDGGGVHIFGGSSKGKTTLLQMAASVWGRGATPGYVRAWRATANGLEGAAASASDTALILDELGVADARDVAASIYGLANGAGKARAMRDGSLREPKSWRVLTLSSGEIPTETKLAEDRGRKARAGQLVRMLDIPADRGKCFGVFDHPGPTGDAGNLVKAIKHAAVTAFGAAGPEFVRRLIAEELSGDDIRSFVADFATASIPRGADGQIDRAAQRLGLIAMAGELAISLGVVPWEQGEAREAAVWALARWIEGRGGTEPIEIRQAIEQVRLFMEQHGDARFEPLDRPEARPVLNRAGWRKGDGADRQWLIPSETWRSEICAGLDASMVARALAKRGMLDRASDGFQQVRKIEGANKRVFVINSKIFDGGEHES